MSSRTICAVIAALALAAAATVAAAKENYHEKALNADTPEKFAVVADNIRKEMSPGGRYEYVKPDERKDVEKALGDITAIFDQNGSIADMKQDTKIRLFNAQEVVNSILTRRDSDRVICKNETKVGSHIPVTTCHTYAQEEEARRGTKEQLDEWLRLGCVNAGCGGSPAKAPTNGDSR
ncbi:MAG TPA: hypothetical protein VKB52_09080 [Rhodanobacteraceae bacterium]|nr:hypothetical protein [Rhodanobacteraceae bacterium]